MKLLMLTVLLVGIALFLFILPRLLGKKDNLKGGHACGHHKVKQN
jgi:hypothetical protein